MEGFLKKFGNIFKVTIFTEQNNTLNPMRLNRLLFFLLLFCAFGITSCATRATEENSVAERSQSAPTPVMVTTAPAQTKTFYHELLCNGVVEVGRMARVGFEANGTIESLPITNGQLVQQGQLLAQLDSREQEMALERARNSLLRAKVEMQDFLLGYSANTDTSKLPPQVLQTARIRSGLSEAELAVREHELRLSKTRITAPISGRVVDLRAKPHNPTASYEYLCHIVDENSLQIAFSVLESELHMAHEGVGVEAYPFSNPSLRGKGIVTEVNRMIDKSGMVSVVAKLEQADVPFIPGMNVRVLVRKPEPECLVIPLDGLTRRQNRNVVFVLYDSLAYWQYVDIGPQNTSEVVIYNGLEEGDLVIVSGNATIGHEAWVREVNNE